jgi:uncharacterized membrane protein YoaK (UPF0700 family)
MFRARLGPQVENKVLLKWSFLAFLAGQINAGGFLSTGRFVSHMTGFGTLFGVEFGSGDWIAALGMLAVPIFFVMGIMISGYFVEMRILHERRPRFDLVMSLIVACLFLCALGGALNWFGRFEQLQSVLHLRDDYAIMALLCLASGLLNAAISSSSSSTVRVTHITGTTTDMGLGFVRWFALRKMANPDEAELKREKMMAEFRLGLIISFALGSAVGTIFFFRFHYLGFLLPMLCSLYALKEARRAYLERSETMV